MSLRTRRLAFRFTLAAALTLGLSVAQADTSRGYFGLSFAIDGDGVPWNPSLKSVTVAKVAESSPAAQSGLVVGDKIIEVEGKTIAGTRARELMPLIGKKPGEHIQVLVQHANGATQHITLTAITRPSGI